MTNLTNKVVKRLLYDEQKEWHNKNNWSIFQDALVSKGVTTYTHPTSATAGLDDKVVFLGDENQINHFNANPADIAKNIMVSRNGPQWEQLGEVIPGENNSDKSGYSVALSDNGSILAIGARHNDENGSNSGHVRVYEYSENEDGNYGWNQLGEDIDGEAAGDNSGHSVSLSADGSILAIGAYRNGNVSGHVRIYQFRQFKDGDNFNYQSRTNNNDNLPLIITENFNTAPVTGKYYWTQLGLDIDGTNNDENLGWSVSLSADGLVVAVGSSGLDLNIDSFFTVYKYYVKDDVLAWHKFGQEFGTPGDGSTLSLSSDGSVVAIGQNLYEDRRGKVIVYQYNNNTDKWDKLGSDILGEAETNSSGWSLSLSADGSILAIGAYFNDSATGDLSGHVRVYKYRKYNSSNDAGNFHHTSTEVNSTQNLPLIITEPNTDPEDGQFYWTQVGLDIDGVNGESDMTGYSVSLNDDGSILAIGAPFSHANGLNTGYVSVYRLENNIWNLIGGSIIGSLRDKCGHSVSLNADGSILAIGCINGDGNIVNTQTYKGHVRVFQIAKRNAWIQQGLDIVDNDADDESGHSVSLNGDGSMLAIGSYAHNEFRGKVDVYVYENSKWKSDLSLSSIDGLFYGFSVSLSKSGSVLAVSSQAWKASTGKVDILEKLENGAWVQLGNSIEGDDLVDKSGWSVSCVDGRENNKPLLVAIGAIGNDGNGSESGHVRVYEYDINSSKEDDPNSPNYGPDGWKRVGQDIYGKAAGYESGYSVSLSADGSTLAIGAPNPTVKPDLISHVRIFNLVEGEWEQQGGDIEEESAYNVSGWSVSLSGDGSRVAIGAPNNNGDSDSTDDYRGHVRVYQRDPDSPNEEDQSSPDYGPTGWKRVGQDIDGEDAGDQNGHSVSLSEDGKILAIGANISELIPSKAGYTRVYRCDVNNEWVRLGFNFEGELGDESSWSISLSGDGKMLAIGSRKSSGSILNSNENTGHVRVYKSAGWGLGTE